MLVFLRGRVVERILRVFAVACCRRIAHLLSPQCVSRAVSVVRSLGCRELTWFPPEAGLRSLEVAERYAAGRATSDELFAAAEAARGVAFLSEYYAGVAGDPVAPNDWTGPYDWELRALGEAAAAVWYACEALVNVVQAPGQAALAVAVLGGSDDEGDAAELAAQAALLRQLVPDPFGGRPA
jgi:hypothetical protein